MYIKGEINRMIDILVSSMIITVLFFVFTGSSMITTLILGDKPSRKHYIITLSSGMIHCILLTLTILIQWQKLY